MNKQHLAWQTTRRTPTPNSWSSKTLSRTSWCQVDTGTRLQGRRSSFHQSCTFLHYPTFKEVIRKEFRALQNYRLSRKGFFYPSTSESSPHHTPVCWNIQGRLSRPKFEFPYMVYKYVHAFYRLATDLALHYNSSIHEYFRYNYSVRIDLLHLLIYNNYCHIFSSFFCT